MWYFNKISDVTCLVCPIKWHTFRNAMRYIVQFSVLLLWKCLISGKFLSCSSGNTFNPWPGIYHAMFSYILDIFNIFNGLEYWAFELFIIGAFLKVNTGYWFSSLNICFCIFMFSYKKKNSETERKLWCWDFQ